MKTCIDCTHYVVCDVIKSFKHSLKKHIKIFRPGSEQPTLEIYRIIGRDCLHYSEKEKIDEN